MLFPAVSAFRDGTTPKAGSAFCLQPLSHNRGKSAVVPCAVGVAVRCEPRRGSFSNPDSFTCLLFAPLKGGKPLLFSPCLFLPNTPKTGGSRSFRAFTRPLPVPPCTGRYSGSHGDKKGRGICSRGLRFLYLLLHFECRTIARRLFFRDGDIFFQPLLFQPCDHFREGGEIAVHSIGFQRFKVFQTVFLCNGYGKKSI